MSDRQRPTAVSTRPAEEEAKTLGEPVSGASLEKVRDILFGVQMRDYDKKLGRLEERLVRETSDVKEDVRRRLAALEQFMKTETESLAERLKAEHDDRSDRLKDLARELNDASRSLEKKLSQIDDQLAKAQRDLRQQILDQHQTLSDEIRQKTDDVLATLAQACQELRAEKADRTALASLFTEMAMRLNNEFTLPGVEDLRNG